ncbi:hypothetical protein [Streptomyces sp. NPDC052721]|uniref:hypothetical protein n=1 Tax=Streptomyces sp. NPDC052721 TaxID=3154955 RepID=UPI00342A4FD8
MSAATVALDAEVRIIALTRTTPGPLLRERAPASTSPGPASPSPPAANRNRPPPGSGPPPSGSPTRRRPAA